MSDKRRTMTAPKIGVPTVPPSEVTDYRYKKGVGGRPKKTTLVKPSRERKQRRMAFSK